MTASSLTANLALREALRGLSSLKQARWKRFRRTFLIALTNKLSVSVSANRARRFKIGLSNEVYVVRDSREKLQIQAAIKDDPAAAEFESRLSVAGEYEYSGLSPWRWASGGYLAIFNIHGVRYCALFLRDIWPKGWNLPIGASSSIRELIRPSQLAEREAKEELVLVNVITRHSYSLDRHNGTVYVSPRHYRLFQELDLPYSTDREPLVGELLPGQPDLMWVRAGWERRRTPYVSEPCLGILNGAGGEAGIEFIQAIEWEIPASLPDLRFLDGEIHEWVDRGDGKLRGKPVLHPIGVFRMDRLLLEFLKPDPTPLPEKVYLYDRVLEGDELEEWLVGNPPSGLWCPVTRKVLTRYFAYCVGIENSMQFKPGPICTITFRGKSFDLPAHAGLGYLRVLLANPNRPLKAMEMVEQAQGGAVLPWFGRGEMSVAEVVSDDLHVLSAGHGDESGLGTLRTCMEELALIIAQVKAELETARSENDSELIAELEQILEVKQDEFEQLATDLEQFKAQTKGRRGHSLSSPQERARQRVAQGLRRAREEIARYDPALSDHLHHHIHGGSEFYYGPPAHIRWNISDLGIGQR